MPSCTPHPGRFRCPPPPCSMIASMRTFDAQPRFCDEDERAASCTRLLLQTKTLMFSRTKIGASLWWGWQIMRRDNSCASGSTSMESDGQQRKESPFEQTGEGNHEDAQRLALTHTTFAELVFAATGRWLHTACVSDPGR